MKSRLSPILSDSRRWAGLPGHGFNATSPRKLIEKVLAEAHAIRTEAAEVKSRFLSTISHEMRTPLNGVSGCSELLELAKTSPSAVGNWSRRPTQGSAAELLILVERVIQAAAVAANLIRPEPTDIELEPFLRRITTSLPAWPSARTSNSTLKLADSPPRRARLHAVWLEETLQISTNPHQVLPRRQVELSAGRPTRTANFHLGRRHRHRHGGAAKIFDSFYQADQSSIASMAAWAWACSLRRASFATSWTLLSPCTVHRTPAASSLAFRPDSPGLILPIRVSSGAST